MTGALTLESVSALLVWTAIVIYALAFLAYAVDLARRGSRAADARGSVTRELVSVGATGLSAEAPAEERVHQRTRQWQPSDNAHQAAEAVITGFAAKPHVYPARLAP